MTQLHSLIFLGVSLLSDLSERGSTKCQEPRTSSLRGSRNYSGSSYFWRESSNENLYSKYCNWILPFSILNSKWNQMNQIKTNQIILSFFSIGQPFWLLFLLREICTFSFIEEAFEDEALPSGNWTEKLCCWTWKVSFHHRTIWKKQQKKFFFFFNFFSLSSPDLLNSR